MFCGYLHLLIFSAEKAIGFRGEYGVKALGKHLLTEFHGCDYTVLQCGKVETTWKGFTYLREMLGAEHVFIFSNKKASTRFLRKEITRKPAGY
jgi:hypothetical protein